MRFQCYAYLEREPFFQLLELTIWFKNRKYLDPTSFAMTSEHYLLQFW